MKSPLPPRADRPDTPADLPVSQSQSNRPDEPSNLEPGASDSAHTQGLSEARQVQLAAAHDAPPLAAEDVTLGPVSSSRKKLRIKYLLRRATHSSRAITTVIVLLLLMAAAIFLAVEAIVEMSGYRAVVSPTVVAQTVSVNLASLPDWILWLSGGIACVLGLFLLGKALGPGSLSRHGIGGDRYALVVEDSVLAAGVSRVVRKAAQLRRGQVKTSVSKRKLTVHVTPTSGVAVNREVLLEAAQNEVRRAGLKPEPRINLVIAQRGEVQP